MFSSLLHRLIVFVLLLAVLSAARAQDDPPGRVGRLNDLSGNVWLYDREANEWEAATNNWPVTQGDRIATDVGARAEVRIGSTTLRLSESTEASFERLDDAAVRLRVERGSLAARLRTPESADEFEVGTREMRARPLRPGHYRVDRSNDTTVATAWDGRLEVGAGANRYQLEPGRRVEFWVDAGGFVQTRWSEVVYDNFAGWARSDAWIDEHSPAARYVSPEMTGIEDLDRHGRWIDEGDDGPLWVPYRVAPGWAPYRDGRWAWVAPWGWTWVDAAPWGFAPFHYGRWVMHRGGWCWAPGRYVQRPVYAPALVAWIGGGPGMAGGIGVQRVPPRVGWFPLGPRETYVPGYRGSDRYVRNLNGGWMRDPSGPMRRPDRYANRDVPGAVTVVPREVIARREPVFPVARRHDADDRTWLRQAAGDAPSLTAPRITPAIGAVMGGRRVAQLPGRGADERDDAVRRPVLPGRDNDVRDDGARRNGLPPRGGALLNDEDANRSGQPQQRDGDADRRAAPRRDVLPPRGNPAMNDEDASRYGNDANRRIIVPNREDDTNRRVAPQRGDDGNRRIVPDRGDDGNRRIVPDRGDDGNRRGLPERGDDGNRRIIVPERDDGGSRRIVPERNDPPARRVVPERDDDAGRRPVFPQRDDNDAPRRAAQQEAPRRVEVLPQRQVEVPRPAPRAEREPRDTRRGGNDDDVLRRRGGGPNDRDR